MQYNNTINLLIIIPMLKATRTICTKNGEDIKYIYTIDQEMSVIVTFGKINEFIQKLDTYNDDIENKFQNIAKAVVYSDNIEMLKILFEKYYYDISFEKSILLLFAIHKRSEKIIHFLLDQLININHCKEIVINLPFCYLNEKLVKILLNNGVLNINHDDDILLFNACMNGTNEFVSYLLSIGAKATSRNGLNLINAISTFNTTKMKLLLDAGALVDSNDGEPLFACIRCGNYDGVELLINYGANIYTGKHGDPLLSCIKFGQTKILELFVKCGAPINKTNYRKIPISVEKEKLIDEIKKSGIDPYIIIKELISDS